MKKWKLIVKSNQRWLIGILLIFIFLGIVLWGDYHYNNAQLKESLFDYFLDPWIGIGTFVLAMIIGYQNLQREWEENLPKKLTVHFKLDDKYVFTCYEAFLADESDIRTWGQQIGKQMNDGGNLVFYPFIDSKKTKIINNEYKRYEVVFHLMKSNFTSYKFWWDNDSKTGNTNQQITCAELVKTPFNDYIATFEKEGKEAFIKQYNQDNGAILSEKNIQIKSIETEQ